MKHLYFIICLGISIGFFASCSPDRDDESNLDIQLERVLVQNADNGSLSFYQIPDETDLENIPADPLNPLTPEKIELGKLLYHEPGLGVEPLNPDNMQTYSCASCHFAGAGFQANRVQGIGEGGMGFGINGEGRINSPTTNTMDLDVQPRRSPTVLNGAYQEIMLWNGQFGATGLNAGTEYAWTPGTPKEVNNTGFQGLEVQAIAGLKVHRQNINDDLLDNHGYRALYDAAFPDIDPSERYNRTTTGLAIAAYERTVLSNQAPFQQWLKGNVTALTEYQKQGAVLFFEKAQCGSCHTGPALNVMDFFRIGMSDLNDCPEEIFNSAMPNVDPGRADFTGRPEDIYKFKVPQLYNLKDSPFFGHGSSFRSVRDVVAYKNKAIPQHSQLQNIPMDSRFVPLGLTETEIDQITDFIENGLHDPALSRYEPTSVLTGMCFPNADDTSLDDLGCE